MTCEILTRAHTSLMHDAAPKGHPPPLRPSTVSLKVAVKVFILAEFTSTLRLELGKVLNSINADPAETSL